MKFLLFTLLYVTISISAQFLDSNPAFIQQEPTNPSVNPGLNSSQNDSNSSNNNTIQDKQFDSAQPAQSTTQNPGLNSSQNDSNSSTNNIIQDKQFDSTQTAQSTTPDPTVKSENHDASKSTKDDENSAKDDLNSAKDDDNQNFKTGYNIPPMINPRPVIGIFTQPSCSSPFGFLPSDYSYIAGPYVQYLEAAGATIIPIPWDLPNSTLDMLLDNVNGILFPGGGTSLGYNGEPTAFGWAGKYIIERAINKNQQGEYFPIWGTCLGYQLVMEVFAQNFSSLIRIKTGLNLPKELKLTVPGLLGKMFDMMDKTLEYDVQHEALAYFDHNYTIEFNEWKKNENLRTNFTITSFTSNGNSTPYAASVEGTQMPVFGTQFHPEKPGNEWANRANINSSREAVELQQYYANFFVNQTKRNNKTISNKFIERLSIWNWKPFHFYNDGYYKIYLIPTYFKNENSEFTAPIEEN